MASEITLEVATPLGLALRVECESVAAPSVGGEFCVLPGHLPLLASLQSGLLRYRSKGQDHIAAIGPGFATVGPKRVELLTDAYCLAEGVDGDGVRRGLESAEQKLKQFAGSSEDNEYEELQRDVDWARAQLALLSDHTGV